MKDKSKKRSLPENLPSEDSFPPMPEGVESFEDLEAKELGGDDGLGGSEVEGMEGDIFERSDPFERPLPKGGRGRELDKPRDRDFLDDEE
jgi:hypothetical protein